MRKAPPAAGTFLCILAMTLAVTVKAQESRPFEDVKPDHWAYRAVTGLQQKGVGLGKFSPKAPKGRVSPCSWRHHS